MKTESVHYEADGLKMIGQPAYDESVSGSRPAVLVFPEAFGLGDHAKSRAAHCVNLATSGWPVTSMASRNWSLRSIRS